MENLNKFRAELAELVKHADILLADLNKNKNSANKFNFEYQQWYSEAQAVVRQLLPDRLDEFNEIYSGEKRKNINTESYSIKDWLRGIRAADDLYSGGKKFDDFGVTIMRFQNQISILKSAEKRFESSLFDIKQLVQADLYDSELDAAQDLNAKGFQRGAGALVGVVLENHLSQVCENHRIKIFKKNPGINDFAESLKANSVIEIPDWRKIQHLADIRNLCDHKKKVDPTEEQIIELVDGAKKLTKTLF